MVLSVKKVGDRKTHELHQAAYRQALEETVDVIIKDPEQADRVKRLVGEVSGVLFDNFGQMTYEMFIAVKALNQANIRAVDVLIENGAEWTDDEQPLMPSDLRTGRRVVAVGKPAKE